MAYSVYVVELRPDMLAEKLRRRGFAVWSN